MQDRALPLEGIHNFRDYGGYASRFGGHVRSGILFRSGQHVDATPQDLDAVAALKLATIIDLRGDSERADFPCARHPDFNAEILFSEGETVDQAHAPHLEAAREVVTARDAHQAMVALYPRIAFRPPIISIFREYIDTLARDDAPSLIHCLAGKDRTGVGVAVVHHVLGVHADDIMEDYLLTNVVGNIERRVAAGAKTVRNLFGPSMEEGAVRTLMAVHPEFLGAAFSAMCDAHGSIDGYAEQALGLTPEKRERIKANLIR